MRRQTYTCTGCGVQFERFPSEVRSDKVYHDRQCYNASKKRASYPDPEGLYDYIVSYCQEHQGLPPTIRDLIDEFDYASTSVANYHVTKLVEAGLIVKGEAGRMQVVGGKWLPPAGKLWSTEPPANYGTLTWGWCVQLVNPHLIWCDRSVSGDDFWRLSWPYSGQKREIDYYTHFAPFEQPEPPRGA